MVNSPSATNQSAAQLLEFAAQHVVPAPHGEPWDYGWHLPDYRNSPTAAIQGPDGPVRLDREGLTAWEAAISHLLREPAVLARWTKDEFWGIAASMTAAAAAASTHEDMVRIIEIALQKFRSARPALSIFLVANVSWPGEPLDFGDVVIGQADDRFLQLVNSSANDRVGVSRERASKWFAEQIDPRISGDNRISPVAIASWSIGQEELAYKAADKRLRSLAELVTLLEVDLPGHRVYRRGSVNRPGLRGLTLDRGSIERGLRSEARVELYLRGLRVSPDFPAAGDAVRWYSSEPFPLGALLEQDNVRAAVAKCLEDHPISARVRTAARWIAEAHYTEDDDDATLALRRGNGCATIR